MSLEDLLQAMLGGAGAGQQRKASSDDPLSEMLEGMLGGGGASQQSGGLEDILGAIMGGGATSQQSSEGGMEDILGTIMGGGQQQTASAGAGGLMDVISAILGGGGGVQQSASPIIEGVSGKTGMSEMVVQMILSFVMSKLLGGMSGGAAGQAGYLQEAQSGGGLNLDGLLEQMGQDEGAAQELAEKTGLDSQTAKKGLEEVLGALGSQRQAPSGGSQANKSGLDGLLESW